MATEILEAKLDNLPDRPGVYLFQDGKGGILYIGKAKSLRHRVRSYFQSARGFDHKTEVLKSKISNLEYIVTDTEVEALILESNLVRKNRPKFNVNLKDDKAFLHIKLTINEPYPRVLLTRRVENDGARYFGPYLPASLARNIVKIINRHFLLRTCDIEITGGLERPCLEYHIKRCLGPCVAGLCSHEEYQRAVQDVLLLLEGKNEELVRSLTEKMIQSSEQQRYEAAAFYRDRVRMVRELAERQKMVLTRAADVDVFAYYREGTRIALQLFTLRSGRVVGKREFFWEDLEYFVPSQFLRDALQQYYLSAGFVPGAIYLPVEIEDQDLIARWLSGKKSRTVHLLVPRRGEKHDLLLLVERNAKIAFENRFKILKSDKQRVLEQLQKDLELPQLPRRIEAFDVSNIQGSDTVASVVVCENGVMKKSEYRKLRIRSVEGPHDFASVYEAVHRRYQRLLAEQRPLPDLILIDGGTGQLHYAYQALSELSIEDTPLASLAKREEHIFLQGQDEPLILPRTSAVLHLLQEIRDEAHRFAVGYHRQRRAMRDFTSELDKVEGIGEKRKIRLLANFGSLHRIREASVEELKPFVGEKIARALKEKLK
ncbi:MAG: excinuclease ABC subunit UvrC [Acidobacteria bacterium]|nr:excinuclease ABC subunit UvrC [Acidobacteriota bacterium]